MNKHSNIYCKVETLYLLSFPFFFSLSFTVQNLNKKLYLFKFLLKLRQTQNRAILTKKKLIGFFEEEKKCKKINVTSSFC